jgi:hypothetical protein
VGLCGDALRRVRAKPASNVLPSRHLPLACGSSSRYKADRALSGACPRLRRAKNHPFRNRNYLGGSSFEGYYGRIAIDAAGDALLVNFTTSTDLTKAINAYHGGSYDAFLAKVTKYTRRMI